jgi:hypothetical protein
MSDNYPDDIDNHNDNPNSPCYEEGPTCPDCDTELICTLDADEDGYYNVISCPNKECES